MNIRKRQGRAALTGLMIASLLATSAVVQAAKTYRWVDADGTVIYSQIPPESGDYTVIETRASSPSSGGDELKQMQEKNQGARDSRQAAAEEEDRRAASDVLKSENCAKARDNLNQYQNPRNKLLKGPDGLYERLTEERRQELIEEAQGQIETFCEE